MSEYYCTCDLCGCHMTYDEWRIFGICATCDIDYNDTWDYESDDQLDEVGYDPYSGTTDPYIDWEDNHHDF